MILALVAAVALGAQDPPRVVIPNSPDVTIRIRVRGPGAHEEDVTVRVKGARQLREQTIRTAGMSFMAPTIVSQCDLRRTLMLSREHKTYMYVPVEASTPRMVAYGSGVTSSGVTSSHTAGLMEQITIDAVDTGERRQFGALTGRHVVTTSTSFIEGETPRRETVRVQDGWYVDVPPSDCIEREGGATYMLTGSVSGSFPPSRHVTQRGRAKRGLALIETDRTNGPSGSWTQTTELVEVSTAPIDPAMFEVPADYRAALPIPGGGFDLSRPDTVGNRLSVLWEGMRAFASRWWP